MKQFPRVAGFIVFTHTAYGASAFSIPEYRTRGRCFSSGLAVAEPTMGLRVRGKGHRVTLFGLSLCL
jgi:hypothetical protein